MLSWHCFPQTYRKPIPFPVRSCHAWRRWRLPIPSYGRGRWMQRSVPTVGRRRFMLWWSLDEVALPGKLLLPWKSGRLRRSRWSLEPFRPPLVVINMADEIAPLTSINPCVDAMPVTGTRIIEYPGETGVGLQHLGVLIGRQAPARVWPEIIAWLNGHDKLRAGGSGRMPFQRNLSLQK
jgi:hypothetical protein